MGLMVSSTYNALSNWCIYFRLPPHSTAHSCTVTWLTKSYFVQNHSGGQINHTVVNNRSLIV